jgi:hypothetical protein
MCKYFTARDDLAVEATRDMDRAHPGTRVTPGLMKASLTVYEPEDDPHPSLPTLREFLAQHHEPETGLLRYDFLGTVLAIDPAPLLALPPEYLDYRISPGSSFVSHEALARAKLSGD